MIAPKLRRNILTMATAYARLSGMKMSGVSRCCRNGNARFLDQLAADPQFGMTTVAYDDMMAWFQENWPKGAERPEINEPFGGRK